MPLRFLQYTTDEMNVLVPVKRIYGRKLLKIPTPHFVVFYNGTEPQPERQILKLSDAYEVREENPQLELQVLVLNINEGYNEDIKAQSRDLREYMQYVDRVREHARSVTLEEAVNRAIEECIREDILKEFLMKNTSAVRSMSLYEFDEEAYLEGEREYAFEEGVEKGRAEGIASERANTERERKRAEEAIRREKEERQRVKTLEQELKELRERYGE